MPVAVSGFVFSCANDSGKLGSAGAYFFNPSTPRGTQGTVIWPSNPYHPLRYTTAVMPEVQAGQSPGFKVGLLYPCERQPLALNIPASIPLFMHNHQIYTDLPEPWPLSGPDLMAA